MVLPMWYNASGWANAKASGAKPERMMPRQTENGIAVGLIPSTQRCGINMIDGPA